ncbi:hypothetical protein [Kitasatospora sp. NPDC002040]|uniref:hypothetical protein n=1 Tax=Kitasatospora sp. NPDC002040 TaxID=3154661 RepID=UPI00332DDD6D
MALGHPARSLGIVAATIGLVLAGGARPASAADAPLAYDGPQALSVYPAAGGPPTRVQFLIDGLPGLDGPPDQPFPISYDTRDLTGIADLTVQPRCSHDGTVYVCETRAFHGEFTNGDPHLVAASGSKLGDTGVLHITATQPETGKRLDTDVTVVIGGPSLEFEPITTQTVEQPGNAVSPVVKIVNRGSLPADRVILTIAGDTSEEFAERFANCGYQTDRPTAVCTIDSPVAPGETVTLDRLPLILPMAKGVVRFYVNANADWQEESRRKQNQHLEPGSGRRLTFGKPEGPVTTSGAANLMNAGGNYTNSASFSPGPPSRTSYPNDIATFGRWAPTGDGLSGTLTIGVRNDGLDEPGPVDVLLALPEGATTVPGTACTADPSALGWPFRCSTSLARTGDEKTFDFPVQLTAAAVGGLAQIAMDRLADDTPANDIVTVALANTGGSAAVPPVTAGGSTPSAGSAGHRSRTGPALGAAAAAAVIGVAAVVTLRRRARRPADGPSGP